MLAPCQSERQSVDVQSGFLFQRESLHVDVQRVVFERLQVDVSADAADAQVGRVELILCPGLVEPVVDGARSPDDE